MKRIFSFAAIMVFAAVFAVSASAQGATKIGWVDTGAFADNGGVTKYVNALKALENEMKPRVTELQGLQTRLQTISNEIKTLSAKPGNVPVDQQAIVTKQEEGQRLQREFEFKKKEYEAALDSRSGALLGPIQQEIGKGLQDFAKQKGYAAVLDIEKLAQANVILVLDPTADVTKEFITWYNARPATTATTTTTAPVRP